LVDIKISMWKNGYGFYAGFESDLAESRSIYLSN